MEGLYPPGTNAVSLNEKKRTDGVCQHMFVLKTMQRYEKNT